MSGYLWHCSSHRLFITPFSLSTQPAVNMSTSDAGERQLLQSRRVRELEIVQAELSSLPANRVSLFPHKQPSRGMKIVHANECQSSQWTRKALAECFSPLYLWLGAPLSSEALLQASCASQELFSGARSTCSCVVQLSVTLSCDSLPGHATTLAGVA